MLTPVESHSVAAPREGKETADASAAAELCMLAAGQILFREGDTRRHVFRVETGALCLFRTLADGTKNVIEFAFPGDLVGLGYLDSHVTAAQATMETTLKCLPPSALDSETINSTRSRARLTAAIERETAFLTETLSQRRNPVSVQQIAALFVTLSRNNTYEGREATIITDSLTCGVVAGFLNMSVDELAALLSDLERRGLIEPAPEGLRLKDLSALEALADTAEIQSQPS